MSFEPEQHRLQGRATDSDQLQLNSPSVRVAAADHRQKNPLTMTQLRGHSAQIAVDHIGSIAVDAARQDITMVGMWPAEDC